MTNEDRIIGTIRTGIPALWGALILFLVSRFPIIGELIAAISEWAGQDVTLALGLLFTVLVITAYYWVARKLGARFPWLERWLMGRSVVPVYEVDEAARAQLTRDAIARQERILGK